MWIIHEQFLDHAVIIKLFLYPDIRKIVGSIIKIEDDVGY